jgi:hypothetical protein
MLGGLDYRSIASHVRRALSNFSIVLGGIDDGGAFALSGDVSPAQLTANTNNWNPGLGTASVVRFSTDASRNITGLAAGTDGQIAILHNVGSQPAVLKTADTNSTAANRFAFDADVTLLGDQSIILQYDATSARWRQLRSSNGEYRSVQVFTASGTWTKPAGLKRVKVTVVGAGGGSGGVAATGANQAAAAGGGAAGGAAIKTIAASALGATETVTVGAAGAAATAGNNAGGTGGTSSFGSHCSATGGTGGGGSDTTGSTTTGANAADGGSGSSGDVNVIGGGSGDGLRVGASGLAVPGIGGSSMLGGGGRQIGTVGSTVGAGGSAYGSGASGAGNGASQSAAAGSAGKAGIVIVEEFF